MKKKSLVGYMGKGWTLLRERSDLPVRTIFLNNMGVARVNKDKWSSVKVRITIEEIK